MAECEGYHKDVRRITKYSKTRQWLRETRVTDLKTPQVQAPQASSTSDEIEEGGVLAALFNDIGTCEIVAPASGVFISLRYDEGDTVGSEAVLAMSPTDQLNDRPGGR